MRAEALMSTDQMKANVRRVAIPSVMRCVATITLFKLLLRIRGYAGTLQWLRNRVSAVPQGETADTTIAQSVEHAVAVAAAIYPGRAKCLEQSLTLYYLLRKQGIAARYCQGVLPYPFQAHAWIEYRGTVINDVAERVVQFARLPDQLP